jgi:hypothetical protein
MKNTIPRTKTDKIIEVICKAVRASNTEVLEQIASKCSLTHKDLTAVSDKLKIDVYKKQNPLSLHADVLNKTAQKYGSVYKYRDANPAQRIDVISGILRKNVANRLVFSMGTEDIKHDSIQISAPDKEILTKVRKALYAVGFHTKTLGNTVTVSQ